MSNNFCGFCLLDIWYNSVSWAKPLKAKNEYVDRWWLIKIYLKIKYLNALVLGIFIYFIMLCILKKKKVSCLFWLWPLYKTTAECSSRRLDYILMQLINRRTRQLISHSNEMLINQVCTSSLPMHHGTTESCSVCLAVCLLRFSVTVC